ncbi:polysaccharide biosynthesis tyrosine autokinase [Marinomonas sp. THO17]|uniref:GumC family protein n=1 Tax=Marinomonas sp. THO17 TaxID=3149048 RepID=UPI00336BF082
MKSQAIQDDEIDLLEVFSIFLNKKLFFIFVFLISVILSVYVFYTSKDTYTSEVNIQVNLNYKGAVSILDNFSLGSNTSNSYGSEIELIKSRNLLSNVVDVIDSNLLDEYVENEKPYYVNVALNEINDFLSSIKSYLPFFDSEESYVEENLFVNKRLEAIKKLQSMLSVYFETASNSLKISITSSKPEVSKNLVNAIASEYMKYKDKEVAIRNKETISWLSEEIDKIKKDIVKSESELKELSGDEDSPDIGIMMNLKEDELNDLSSKINDLEESLAIENIYISKLDGVDDPNVILESPLITSNSEIERTRNSISSAEARLLEASLKYGFKHPRYVAAKENLDNLISRLYQQVQNQLSIKKSIHEVERKKLSSLYDDFDRIKVELNSLGLSEDAYMEKLREVETYRNLYDITLRRLQESQSVSNIKNEVAKVLDYALLIDVVNNDVRYKKALLVVLLGSVLGVFISLLFGVLDQKIYTKRTLELLTGIPNLINLPKTTFNKGKNNHFRYSKNKAYIESIYRLRTQLRSIHKDKKVITIASAKAREGKSTVSLHLAKALSELEKTLVIDIDFRRQSIAKYLNIPSNRPGISDIIAKKSKVSDAITQNHEEGFDVMGAGTYLDKPNDLLSSHMMEKILDYLKDYYDRIIIETPPIQLFSDAESVAKFSDGLVFIVKSGNTKKRDVAETIEQLKMIEVNLIGSILNQAKIPSRRKSYINYVK